ncbi:MAG: hypothetical protein HC831_28890, partial [Chloroflexia bacterium]|nr:hypothetical protein [Chloroflexia bacterium]
LAAEVVRIRKQGTDQMKEMYGQLTGLQKQQAEAEKRRIAEVQKLQADGERALLELKLALMDEGIDKQLAIIDKEYDAKLEKLIGSEAQITEQKILIEQQRATAIANAKRTEEDKLRAEDDEMEKLILEEKFLNMLLTEEEYQTALTDQKRSQMQEELDMIKAMHGEESLEYQRKYNELLKLDQEHNDKVEENAERTAEFKKKIGQGSLDAAQDFLSFGIEMLSKDEESRKKNAEKIKNFQRAQVFLDGIKEIASIWKHSMELGPIAGPIVGAVQTALSLNRTGMAMRKIDSTEFESGGIFGGSRHSEGGNAVIDSRTGAKIAEVEAGEPYLILSRNTYANNRRVVDQLLYSSMYQNGAPIFETGGIMNPYRSQTASTPVNGAAGSGSGAAGASVRAASADSGPALIAEIRALRSDVIRMNTSLRAYVVYDDLRDAQREIEQVESDARLS